MRRYEPAGFILNALAKEEDDPSWAADLRAAAGNWLARLRYVSQVVAAVRAETIEQARADGASDDAVEAAARLLQCSPELLIGPDGTLARPPVALDPPLEASLYASAARAFYMQRRFNEAIGPVRHAVEKDPSSAEYWLLLAAIQAPLGQTDAALDACREALKRRPGWETSAAEIGVILLEAGRPAEAADQLRAMVNERGSEASPQDRPLAYAVAIPYRSYRSPEIMIIGLADL